MLAEFRDMVERAGAESILCDLPSLPGHLHALRERDPAWHLGLSQEIRTLLPNLSSLERRSPDWPEICVGRGMFGIAATGTVVMAEATYTDRLAALLCVRHVVVLPGGALIDTWSDAAPILRGWLGRGTGRYVTFVTGPSRTSDIERVLTIGVHGPRELVVLVVEGWQPDGP
jgi:L-lactate dehydrogenase complex protein LldG